MKGQVALVHEQGQRFAVLAVKRHIIGNGSAQADMLQFGLQEFGVRTALLTEDGRTHGPNDIVRWLEGVDIGQLPWRDFWTDN